MNNQQPLSMAEASVGMHELFLSLQDAGFTEAQAFELVKAALVSASQNARDDE